MPVQWVGEWVRWWSGMHGRGATRARLGFWVVGVLLGGMTTVLGSATPGTSVAEPVTRAETCTISGTPRADQLVGTSGRDVVCGRGGDDVIRSAGGNDLLRGGDGSDRLLGGSGADVLGGGSGPDDLVSGDGADQLLGGGGADTLRSAAGRDVLAGGLGDDDLDGGPGSDDIDGGPGTNWCILDAQDTAVRCVYDEAAPSIQSVEVSGDSVDVTNGPQFVPVRVHLTDDTGIESAGVGAKYFGQTTEPPHCSLDLVEGNRRDGWWECAIAFSRWEVPGTYTVSVGAHDRIGRSQGATTAYEIEVQNAAPDLEPPMVTLLAPGSDEVIDVRSEDSEVVVEARITDDLSGVGERYLLLWEPRGGSDMASYGFPFRRVSGDAHDGIYRATGWIAKGAVAGNWNVQIGVSDRAGLGAQWYGPDLYEIWGNEDTEHPFPDGMGRVPVLGEPRSDDRTPPRVTGASVSPTHIDTLPGPATVHLTVAASDEGTGIDSGVSAEFILDDPGEDLSVHGGVYDRTSGTRFDGVYENDITFPQGMPPGIYRLSIWASDAALNAGTTRFYDTTVTVIDSRPDP
jgi:RTX calcium-binding nonapeptide repeat (4 copies)